MSYHDALRKLQQLGSQKFPKQPARPAAPAKSAALPKPKQPAKKESWYIHLDKELGGILPFGAPRRKTEIPAQSAVKPVSPNRPADKGLIAYKGWPSRLLKALGIGIVKGAKDVATLAGALLPSPEAVKRQGQMYRLSAPPREASWGELRRLESEEAARKAAAKAKVSAPTLGHVIRSTSERKVIQPLTKKAGLRGTPGEKFVGGLGEFVVPFLVTRGYAAGLARLGLGGAEASGATVGSLRKAGVLKKAGKAVVKGTPEAVAQWGLMEAPKPERERTPLKSWLAQYAVFEAGTKVAGSVTKLLASRIRDAVAKRSMDVLKVELPKFESKGYIPPKRLDIEPEAVKTETTIPPIRTGSLQYTVELVGDKVVKTPKPGFEFLPKADYIRLKALGELAPYTEYDAAHNRLIQEAVDGKFKVVDVGNFERIYNEAPTRPEISLPETASTRQKLAKDIRKVVQGKVVKAETKPLVKAMAKEPWEMTKEEFMQNPSAGFVYDEKLRNEARALPDGRIAIGPKFFELPPDARKYVLRHEWAHTTGIEEAALRDDEFWRLLQEENLFGPVDAETKRLLGGINGQTIPSENVVEAYTLLFEDPDWLKTHYPKAYEYVAKLAIKEGKPVPPEVLKDYPDLAETASAKRLTQKETGTTTGEEVQKMAFQTPVGLRPQNLPTRVDDVTVRGIVNTISKLFGVPVRVGRFRQLARAIYKVRPEVIRSKLATDLPAIAHEVGHHLDKVLGLSKQSQFAPELEALAQNANMQGVAEGVGEYIRLFITNPSEAYSRAPNFTNYFNRVLADNPEIEKALYKVRDMIDALISATPEQRLQAIISMDEQPNKRRLSWSGLYKAWVDELTPIRLFVQEAQKVLGKIDELADPFLNAWAARGWVGKAQTLLYKGFNDSEGKVIVPGLEPIIRRMYEGLGVRGNNQKVEARKLLSRYLLARRILEIKDRVEILPGQGVMGRDQVIADAEAVVRSAPKPIVEAAEAINNFNRALLDKLVEGHLLSPDARDAILQKNLFYVPLHRVFEEVMEAGRSAGGLGRGYIDIPEIIKRMKGSDRPVVDPLESIVKNVYLFTQAIERNKVALKIVELASKGEGLGKWAERVDPKMYAINITEADIRRILEASGISDQIPDLDLDAAVTLFRPLMMGSSKENIGVVWINGEKTLWQFHPELYESLKWLDHETTNFVVRWLQTPAQVLRAGAVVYNPIFWLRNPMRDQFTSFVFSKYGYIPGFDLIRGLFHVIRRDDLYWLYQNSGAAHATLVSLDRNYLQTDLRRIFGIQESGTLAWLRRNVLERMQSISEAFEEATRIGEFERGLKKEGRNERSILKAALAARDVTLDFGRVGTYGKQVNKIVAFFNANVQGLDKVIRQFKEDPAGTTFRAALCVSLPSIILYMINRNNPNYWALSDRERDLYWHIPLPNGKFFRYPKPFEVGILFGSFIERTLAWMEKQDPVAVDSFAREMAPLIKNFLNNSVPIPIPTSRDLSDAIRNAPWPTALVPALEILTGKSMYTGRPIVPQTQEGLEPWLQYTPYTSETAKLIGKALNVSPLWVDEILGATFGGIARFATSLIDEGLRMLGMVEGEKGFKASKLPIIENFFAEPYAGNEPTIEQFYKLEDEASTKVRSVKEMLLRGEKPKLTERDRALILYQPLLSKLRNQLSDIRWIQRHIMFSPNLTDEEKDAVFEILDYAQINVVRRFFNLPAVVVPESTAEKITPKAQQEIEKMQQLRKAARTKAFSDAIRRMVSGGS